MSENRPTTIFIASTAPVFQIFTFIAASYNGVLLSPSFIVVGILMTLFALVVVSILKRSIHKKRPPKKQEYFKPFGTYAFPSGHATVMVALAVYITYESYFFGCIALALSCVVMIARVHAKVHDVYDMIAGTILGVMFAYVAHNILTQLHMIHLV